MPTPEQATRVAVAVGGLTTIIGGALAAAPERTAALGGLQDATGLRIIGLADLALVPGLVAGRPRWPWMGARAALNIAIAAYLLRRPAGPDRGRHRLAVTFLAVVTTQDARMAAVLKRAGA